MISLVVLLAITTSFKKNAGKSSTGRKDPSSNPFLTKSTLPYQAPPFNKIKDTDFKPALEQGMTDQLQEIQKVANNTAAPTFENTLVAMEKSGQLYNRVNNVFNLPTGANTNRYLQQVQEEIARKQAAHQDAVYLNSKFF